MIFIWAMSGNVAVCIGPIYSTYIAYGVGWYVTNFFSGFYAGRLNHE